MHMVRTLQRLLLVVLMLRAVGTLTLGTRGEARFFGQTSRSEVRNRMSLSCPPHTDVRPASISFT